MNKFKKEEELKYANAFLFNFNLINKLDYIAEINDDEDNRNDYPYVDIWGISKIHKRLMMQIKNIDVEYMREFPQKVKEAKESSKGLSDIYARSPNIISMVNKSIKECKIKYKGIEAQIILILGVYYGAEINLDYAKKMFLSYKSLKFKGIYLVELPHNGDKGKCVPIKEINI